MTSADFNQIVLDAVDQALSKLGESIRGAILFYLERDFNLTREKIAGRPDELHRALTSIFGAGAKPLELEIVKLLFQRMGVYFVEKEPFDFAAEVERARSLWRRTPSL